MSDTDDLEQEIAELQEERDNLQDSVSTLETERDDLKAKNERLAEKVSDATTALRLALSDLEAR